MTAAGELTLPWNEYVGDKLKLNDGRFGLKSFWEQQGQHRKISLVIFVEFLLTLRVIGCNISIIKETSCGSNVSNDYAMLRVNMWDQKK